MRFYTRTSTPLVAAPFVPTGVQQQIVPMSFVCAGAGSIFDGLNRKDPGSTASGTFDYKGEHSEVCTATFSNPGPGGVFPLLLAVKLSPNTIYGVPRSGSVSVYSCR